MAIEKVCDNILTEHVKLAEDGKVDLGRDKEPMRSVGAGIASILAK